jgi:hypothetical protein
MLYSAPASAQATRTWISGVGDDANPCSRTAPCKTFAGAISKTAAGGEINCLDPGGFGAVTITKSISLVCDQTLGSVLVSGTPGITINGANIIVTLSGMELEGLANTGFGGTNGINFVNGASLTVRNSVIRGFSNGYGINFQPSANAQLFVQNSLILDNGSSANAATGGIRIGPASNVTVKATISDSQVANNINTGIRLDSAGLTGVGIFTSVDSSEIVNNGTGFFIKTPPGTGTANLTINHSSIVQNANIGVSIAGPSTAMVGDTTITANGIGLSLASSGVAYSYGDNRLNGNGTDGAFSSILPKQ